MKINSKFPLNCKLYVSNGKLHGDSCIWRAQSVIAILSSNSKYSLFSANASQVFTKWPAKVFWHSSYLLSRSTIWKCGSWISSFKFIRELSRNVISPPFWHTELEILEVRFSYWFFNTRSWWLYNAKVWDHIYISSVLHFQFIWKKKTCFVNGYITEGRHYLLTETNQLVLSGLCSHSRPSSPSPLPCFFFHLCNTITIQS